MLHVDVRGHAGERPLAHGVGHSPAALADGAGRVGVGRGRDHVHDGSRALFHHCGQHPLGDRHLGEHVPLEQLVNLGLFQVKKRGHAHFALVDSVVHQYIEMAEMLQCAVDACRDAFSVQQVHGERHSLLALGFDGGHGGVESAGNGEVGVVHVPACTVHQGPGRHGHVKAGPSQCDGAALSDSPAGSGDQGGLSIIGAHLGLCLSVAPARRHTVGPWVR